MQAHAPGSVTTIFAPQSEQSVEGSLGVSFALADGVMAEVEDARRTTIRLNGESTEFAPVEIALEELDVTAEISLTAEIPVGYGFGASGAATLATALAANDAFGLGRSREELVEVAHRAELEAGTGLGDVFIQSLGGLVWNTGDRIERVERTDRIEYTAFAGMATADALSDDQLIERISTNGRDILTRFSPTMSTEELFGLSWEFSQQTGLATERVREEVARVEQAGGIGSMAMVGETVVATGVQGVLVNETRMTPQSARLLESA